MSLACALADALTDTVAHTTERLAHLRDLTDRLWTKALTPFIVSGLILPTGPPHGGPDGDRAVHHVSFCIRGVNRAAVLQQLEEQGVIASGGSACSSDSGLPSPVLVAMRIPTAFIHGSVRISLSHVNTADEIESVVIPALRRTLQRYS